MKFSKLSLTWLFLSILVFIYISRYDTLRAVSLVRWETFAALPSLSPGWHFVSDALLAWLKALIFVIATSGWGWLILRAFRFQHPAAHFLWVTAFSGGEIVLSIFLMILASQGALSPSWSLGLLSIGCLLAVPALKWLAASLQKGRRILLESGAEEKKQLLLGALVLIAALFYTSSRLSYDASLLYFSLPKRIAMSYEVQPIHPTDLLLVNALYSSILFTPLIQLFGDQAARALTWFQAIAMLVGMYEVGKQAGLSRQARFYVMILALTTTAFVDLIGDAKIDLISFTPLIVASGWLLQALDAPPPETFLLAGLYFGFAVIAKPLYVFLLMPFLTVLFLGWIRDDIRLQGWKQGIRSGLSVFWMLPFAFINGVLYLWLNSILLGNALAAFEFANRIDWSPWLYFDRRILPLLRVLYLPAITFLNIPSTMGNLSPLVIGILPFLLYRKVRSNLVLSPELRRILLASLSALIPWVTFSFALFEIRYVFFLWFLLFLLVAQLLEASWKALPRKQRYWLQLSILFLTGFVAARAFVISLVTYSPIRADGTPQCSLLDPFCTFLEPLNQRALPGERIFVLDGYRYYLRPDLLACSSMSQEYEPLRELAQKDGEAFWIELYRQGFRYLTYEVHFAETHAHFPEIPSPQEAPSWLKVTQWNVAIYELKAVNPPFTPVRRCERDALGRWRIVELP
jgi:hypothetical protein